MLSKKAQWSRRAQRPARNHIPSHSGPTIHLHLHLHLHTDAINGFAGTTTPDCTEPTGGTGPVDRVQGHGPQALETVQRWLADLGSRTTINLTPVVDVIDHLSVDAYEVPDRPRTMVEHRDHGCRFPWCGRAGRFDADHIDEYIPVYKGGPPDQTNSDNLDRLCRFHHRVKTHGGWHYRRQPDDNPTTP